MSIIHYIKINKEVDFESLEKEIKKRLGDVECEQRGDDIFYFWLPEKSTRGVDFTFETESWIEIRNTIASNQADYLLTNHLAEVFCQLFDGKLYKDNDDFEEDFDAPEDQFIEDSFPVFEQKKVENTILEDCKLIRVLINNGQAPITIFGPIRKVHFGDTLMKKWEERTPEALAIEMEQMILTINYQLPEYEYGNIMELSRDENNKKIIKLLTNNACVIDKYDYIILNKPNADDAEKIEDFTFITNDDLLEILPETWKQLDEYQILAPELTMEEFEILKQKALSYNRLAEIYQA